MLGGAGLERVIGLVLTPHGSSLGSQEYLDRAAAALGDTPFVPVAPWYAEPSLVALLAARVQDALAAVDRCGPGSSSLRTRCPSASARAATPTPSSWPSRRGWSPRRPASTEWLVAWQSAGRTPEPWLGPDVRDVVRQLGADATTDAVVVCPIGFVADHLEVLYDLDVELAGVAASCGLAYRAHGIAQRRPGVHRRAGRPDRRRRRGAPDMTPRRVVVVGGGISGLTAAWELTGGGGTPARCARGHPCSRPRRASAGRCRARTSGARRRHGPRRVPGPPARGRRPVPPGGDRRLARAHRGPGGVGLGPRATPHAARGARARDPDQVLADRPLGHRGHARRARPRPRRRAAPTRLRVDRSAIVPSAPSWRTSWAGVSSTPWWIR